MNACHRRGAGDANQANAALVFLAADIFMSEGALASVVRRHATGSRAVVCTNLRLNRETFVASLAALGGIRMLPPRDLISVALQHLHPFTRAHFADTSPSVRLPTGVYWPVPNEGLVARSFHLLPLMVDPVRRNVVPKGTIDGHYLMRCCPRRDQVHVVTDSDEFVMFDLTAAAVRSSGTRRGTISPGRVAAVASRCDAFQRANWSVCMAATSGIPG